MNMNRKRILKICLVLSIAAHALLLALSPGVRLLTRHVPNAETERFQVTLREDEPEPAELIEAPPETPAPSEPEPFEAPTRLFEDAGFGSEAEEIDAAPEPTNLASVDVSAPEPSTPSIPLGMEGETFEPNADVMDAVDTRLIEIAQEDARVDLEVDRRAVRPSTDRVLPEDLTPVMRGPGEFAGEPMFLSAGSAPLPGGFALDGDVLDRLAPGVPDGAALAESLPSSVAEPQDLPSLPADPSPGGMPQETGLGEDTGYAFWDDLLNIRIETYIAPDDPEGYFRLTISPRADSRIEALPKDIMFVVDASRSIQQRKMDQVTRALQTAVRNLRPEDRFNVVLFRDTANPFRPSLTQATPENIQAAERFLNNVETHGSTDIYEALRHVLDTSTRDGLPAIVVLVSDGHPTVGIVDARLLINSVTGDNRDRKSVFAFGGGQAIDRRLLDLLAYRNRGSVHTAASLSNVEWELAAFLTELQDPLLTNLEAVYGRLDASRIFPRELPDFFMDRPITIYGRFDPAGDTSFVLRLTGRAGPERKAVVFQADLEDALVDDPTIAREWGFRKAYHLIGEIAEVGEEPPLLAELRSVTERYGVRTSYNH